MKTQLIKFMKRGANKVLATCGTGTGLTRSDINGKTNYDVYVGVEGHMIQMDIESAEWQVKQLQQVITKAKALNDQYNFQNEG
jgi:hypothetical protein